MISGDRYGASDSIHVVGGLAEQPLADIAQSVADMGFNVVRLFVN
jgi:hypothetical protein